MLLHSLNFEFLSFDNVLAVEYVYFEKSIANLTPGF